VRGDDIRKDEEAKAMIKKIPGRIGDYKFLK
jgi:hypothetical protein